MTDKQWEARKRAGRARTLAALRQPSRYYIISDAQLKRDLKGRTLAQIFADNRRGR